jgi:hypothetical protein
MHQWWLGCGVQGEMGERLKKLVRKLLSIMGMPVIFIVGVVCG